MVKRTAVTPGKKKVPVGQPKRRRRAPPGRLPSRASLRCRGVSGEDPVVQYPNGMPVFRFPRSEYHRPICRMYGVDRSFKYKGFFFCTNCRIADESLTTKGMMKSTYRIDGKKHACEADHHCYAFPTDKGKLNHVMMKSVTNVGRSQLMKQREIGKKLSSNPVSCTVINQASTVDTRLFFSKSKKDLFKDLSKLEEALSVKEDELHQAVSNLVSVENELSVSKTEVETKANELDYTLASLQAKEEEANALEEENKKLRELLRKLQTALTTLRDHLRLSQQQVRRERDQVDTVVDGQNTETLVATICDLLALATSTKNCSRERKAAAFADLLLDGSVMDGVLSDQIKKKLTQDIRATVFSAPALMKKMDECGFVLNYAALEAIGDMERSVMGKFHRGLFPSTKTIKRNMEIVHAFGDHVLPFTLSRFPDELGGGELAQFPQELVLKAIIKSHGLLEKAKSQRVGVGYTYDGTKIDSRTYLEISGFKITDRDAKDPRTGRLLYGNGLQSSACSFPDTLGIAKDTKEVFEVYKPRFIRVANEAASVGEPMLGNYVSANGEPKKYKHVEATSEMDMKSVWMINNVGCAAKQGGDNVMFCSFCPLTNRDIAKGTKNLCHRWCRQYGRENRVGWICHHVDMVTDDHVNRCKEEVKDMMSLNVFFSELDDIHPKCKINTDEDPTEDSCGPQHTKDPASIHFKYSEGTMAQKMQFLNAVRHDLALRGIATDGCAREQIQRLRSTMSQEFGFKKLQVAIKRGTIDREGAITLILNNPPCLLHLENRCGIKMVTTILEFGLTNALNGQLDFARDVRSQKDRLGLFEKNVNDCFNKVLWGQRSYPACWKLPVEKDKDGNTVISTLSFGNVRARLALNTIDELLDICIPENCRQAWKDCLSEYRNGMAIARSHIDLTDDQIVEFQQHIDEFYQAWVHLALGKKGITNYIHLLGSGHIAEFLFRWRNLYAHSQQGWEALNSLVRSVYFRRTNQGGGREKKSKLYAIARWCQRRMLWSSGYTFDYMEAEVKRNNWTVSDVFEQHAADLPVEDTYDEYVDSFI